MIALCYVFTNKIGFIVVILPILNAIRLIPDGIFFILTIYKQSTFNKNFKQKVDLKRQNVNFALVYSI